MMAADQKLEELSNKIADCLLKHGQVVQKLMELADELDTEEREMGIAKMGFATSSAIGNGIAEVGFGLSFVTFGTSLTLTAVGAGISAVSGAGDIATQVAEKVVDNWKVKEAKAAVESYSVAINSLSPVLESFCAEVPEPDQEKVWTSLKDDAELTAEVGGIIADTRMFAETFASIRKLMNAAKNTQAIVHAVEGGGGTASKAVPFGTDIFVKGGDEAFGALGTGAKAIKIGRGVLAGVGVVIDVGSIIYYGIKVHKRKPSEVAELIRKLANAIRVS